MCTPFSRCHQACAASGWVLGSVFFLLELLVELRLGPLTGSSAGLPIAFEEIRLFELEFWREISVFIVRLSVGQVRTIHCVAVLKSAIQWIAAPKPSHGSSSLQSGRVQGALQNSHSQTWRICIKEGSAKKSHFRGYIAKFSLNQKNSAKICLAVRRPHGQLSSQTMVKICLIIKKYG